MTDKNPIEGIKKVSNIFDTCIRGHRTVDKSDFVYDSMSRRLCKACVLEDKKSRTYSRRKLF